MGSPEKKKFLFEKKAPVVSSFGVLLERFFGFRDLWLIGKSSPQWFFVGRFVTGAIGKMFLSKFR